MTKKKAAAWEPKFKRGDVVTLKSGGLRMTVDEYTCNGHVRCFWAPDNYGQHRLDHYEDLPTACPHEDCLCLYTAPEDEVPF